MAGETEKLTGLFLSYTAQPNPKTYSKKCSLALINHILANLTSNKSQICLNDD